MSTRLLARFRDFLPALTLLRSSLLWRVSTSFSCSRFCSTRPDFHVQLSSLCLTSDWESFLSHIQIDLNPKSNSSALLRTA
jgi:hypothetical protein